MGNTDICDICKQHVSHNDMDWLKWESTGVIAHITCCRAQSEVLARPLNIKTYSDKTIPSGLKDKIIKDNIIGEI